MDYLETNDELQHHGVKGMKWGVRRSKKEVNNLRKMASRANDESTARQLNAAADKKASELSEQERELAKAQRARQLKKGAAAVATALALVGAAYVGKKMHDQNKATRLAEKDLLRERRDAAKKAKKAAKLDKVLERAAEKVKSRVISSTSQTTSRTTSSSSSSTSVSTTSSGSIAKKASVGASIVAGLLSSTHTKMPTYVDGDIEFYQ